MQDLPIARAQCGEGHGFMEFRNTPRTVYVRKLDAPWDDVPHTTFRPVMN